MVIHNSKNILKDLGKIEAEISRIEQFIYNQDLNINLEKLLEDILQNYCGET